MQPRHDIAEQKNMDNGIRPLDNKKQPEKTYEEKLKEYEEKLKAYKEETQGMTPLQLHVMCVAKKNGNFSPSTVTARLDKMHASGSGPKGLAIAMFNAAHSGSWCPAHGTFSKDEKTLYGRFLHLGTTRIWNPDGTFNEERWQKLVKFASEDQKGEPKLTQSKLHAYLNDVKKTDPQENNTGRNTNSFFSSRPTQELAAVAAWDEVFTDLACGWEPTADNKVEPYLTLALAEEFFRDSGAAYLRAECELLPAPKPVAQEEKVEANARSRCAP